MSVQPLPAANGLPSPPATQSPLQLSIPLPNTHLPIRIHLHLTITPASILLFLTTAFGASSSSQALPSQNSGPLVDTSELDAAASTEGVGGVGGIGGIGGIPINPFSNNQSPPTSTGSSPLGSFVVAMPNLRNPTSLPLTTPIYTTPSTLETATRIASILAAKTRRPVYVGNSMDFGATGAGGSVHEVVEGIRRVVAVVRGEVERAEGVAAA